MKEIKELSEKDFSASGFYVPNEVFSTRYFLTTNGLPIEKGENYTQWNLFGPDFQFGVGKNFGLGVMTSWFGVPLIGSAKYTFELGENAGMAVGTLLGTGSWANPELGIALPYTAFTLGDRKTNITLSVGYGGVFGVGDSDGDMLVSIAGMSKVSREVSLVFDSFIIPGTVAFLIPGFRWQMESNKAFQFGFAGVVFDGELAPVPVPMVQWFRKIGN